jgi:hypothetical protein
LKITGTNPVSLKQGGLRKRAACFFARDALATPHKEIIFW